MFKTYLIRHIALGFLYLLSLNTPAAMADTNVSSKTSRMTNKIIFQVSDGDPRKWNLTLINALNVIAELGKHHVAMEIVVYGPAIDMLKLESEVAPRVDEVISGGVKVVACENTMRGDHLTPADMLPGIHYTRSGVVYLMKKQNRGYAYIRP